MAIVYFFIFFLGLTTGSFLNSVIWRLQTGAPHHLLLKSGGGFSRSYCPHCKTTLRWQDLIPLLSFFILKGRCRYCHQKISWQYPLVEIATGLLFLLIFNFPAHLASQGEAGGQFQISNEFPILNFQILNFFYYLLISCFLIIIFVSDLRYYIIPDKIVYPAIVVSGIWYLVSGIFLDLYTKYEILNTIYSAFGASAFFLAIVLVSRGKWMGWGDPKLAFFMGLFLGFPKILVALFFAFFIGAIIGIGLMIFRKKTLKSEIPFGPFLVGGTFIALFWGRGIINWYLNLFWQI